MADFAKFAVACESDDDAGMFLAAYTANETNAHDQALESSPLALALLDFLDRLDSWEGRPTEPFEVLTTNVGNRAKSPDWPKTPAKLSNKLKRLVPNLLKSKQIEVLWNKKAGGNRTGSVRTIGITRVRDGERTEPGRCRDGDETETPSRENPKKTSDKPSGEEVRDGRDDKSPLPPGGRPRKTYGARNGPTSAKGGPAK